MFQNIERLSQLIAKKNKILFFTGAGLSTSSGIKDFRGTNGIYQTIGDKYNLPYPESLFEINFFNKNPLPFYDFSKELFNHEIKPSFSHNFISALEKMSKISLIVTQNIDMLHEKSGSKKILNCHGSYNTAHCLKCKTHFNFNQFENNLKSGIPKNCKCGGIIKPDIIFFGEQLPEKFYHTIENPPDTDLLIVLGSSLTVQPAAMLPILIKKKFNVEMVIINNQSTEFDALFDIVIHQDIDTVFKNVNSILNYYYQE